MTVARTAGRIEGYGAVLETMRPLTSSVPD